MYTFILTDTGYTIVSNHNRAMPKGTKDNHFLPKAEGKIIDLYMLKFLAQFSLSNSAFRVRK